MQFIDIQKARGIKFGQIVLGKTTAGDIHRIKAVSKSEDAKGIHYNFEYARFEDEDQPDPIGAAQIIAVAIPKVKSSTPIDHSNNDNLAFNG